MKLLVALVLMLLASTAFAYTPDKFPLDGFKFIGYEGCERGTMYELGFILLWIIGPICLITGWAAIAKAQQAPGCLVFPFVLFTLWYAIFFLVNWEYTLGFTLGPLIIAGAAGMGAAKSIFGNNGN